MRRQGSVPHNQRLLAAALAQHGRFSSPHPRLLLPNLACLVWPLSQAAAAPPLAPGVPHLPLPGAARVSGPVESAGRLLHHPRGGWHHSHAAQRECLLHLHCSFPHLHCRTGCPSGDPGCRSLRVPWGLIRRLACFAPRRQLPRCDSVPPLPQGGPGVADAADAPAALVAAFRRHAEAQLLTLDFEGKLILKAVSEEARNDPHSVSPFLSRQRGCQLDPRAVCAAAGAAAGPPVSASVAPLQEGAAAAARLVLAKAAAPAR